MVHLSSTFWMWEEANLTREIITYNTQPLIFDVPKYSLRSSLEHPLGRLLQWSEYFFGYYVVRPHWAFLFQASESIFGKGKFNSLNAITLAVYGLSLCSLLFHSIDGGMESPCLERICLAGAIPDAFMEPYLVSSLVGFNDIGGWNEWTFGLIQQSYS